MILPAVYISRRFVWPAGMHCYGMQVRIAQASTSIEKYGCIIIAINCPAVLYAQKLLPEGSRFIAQHIITDKNHPPKAFSAGGSTYFFIRTCIKRWCRFFNRALEKILLFPVQCTTERTAPDGLRSIIGRCGHSRFVSGRRAERP